MERCRVFLADDHGVVREGLKALISAHPDMEVVGEASDGETAVEKMKEFDPDVVVMDVSMPGMGGAQATELIKRENPRRQVLALTVHEERSYLRLLLEAGVSGFVLKRSAASEILNAIRTVFRGDVHLDQSLTTEAVNSLRSRPKTDQVDFGSDLSSRETETLKLIALGHSNKEIAVRMGVSVKTVETYKKRSVDKLGLRSRVDIVRYATERGWTKGF